MADVVCDIRELQFPSDHADAIAAIHVVEHVYRWECEPMLAEWLRVLKPGGHVIIEVPCMDKVLRYVADAMEQNALMSPTFSWYPLWGDPSSKNPLMCHKWGYTYQMLSQALVKAGFTSVRPAKARYHFPQRDMRVTAVKPLPLGA